MTLATNEIHLYLHACAMQNRGGTSCIIELTLEIIMYHALTLGSIHVLLHK